MAKVKPTYEAVKHTGIAAGDDVAPATLAPYDQVKYSGVSTSSQPDGVSPPAPTPGDTSSYPAIQNKGGDTAPHGVGGKASSPGSA
jgi:hypothetical protein